MCYKLFIKTTDNYNKYVVETLKFKNKTKIMQKYVWD